MRATVAQEFLRLRVWRTFGLACVLAGMMRYESFSDRSVLNRWSVTYVGALAMMLLLVAASATLGRGGATSARAELARRRFFDLGLAASGVAYLLSALDDGVQGGRLLDFNVFGSIAVLPTLLEWVGMMLLACAAFAWLAVKGARRFGNALLASGAVVVVFLLGEIAARTWTLTTASTHLGNASKVWQRRFVQRNSAGARDVEHARSATNRRLLVVGDSYAFGWGVERVEDRFGEQLAMRLSSPAERWESINFAEPDRHLLQEFPFLREGLRYAPDLAIQIYVFNDIDYLAPVTPRLMVVGGPAGIHRLHPLRVLFANSYLFQEIYARLAADAERRAARTHSRFAVYDDTALVDRHIEDLKRFAAVAESAHVPMAFVPLDPATGADSSARRRYASFVDRVRAHGLPVISIEHAFDGVPIERYTVSSLDGHPNALGHRLAAQAAAGPIARLWAERKATIAAAPIGRARRGALAVAPPSSTDRNHQR